MANLREQRNIIVAKLGDTLPSRKLFRKRLAKACKQHAESDANFQEEPTIQPRDVVAALRVLDEEDAFDQLRELTLKDRRSSKRVKKDHFSPTTDQPQPSTAKRTRSARTSKAAAGAKITTWTKVIKPSRNATPVQKLEVDVEVAEVKPEPEPSVTTTPIEDELNELTPVPSTCPGRGRPRAQTMPSAVPARGKKRALSGSPPPLPRRASHRLRPNDPGSSYEASSPDETPALPAVTRTRPSRQSRPVSLQLDILPSQQEHAALFAHHMPVNQHFKRANPTIIEDVLAISDPSALSYPVEVYVLSSYVRVQGQSRRRSKKGELYEMNSAAEFHDHQNKVAAILEAQPTTPTVDFKRRAESNASKTPECATRSPSDVSVSDLKGSTEPDVDMEMEREQGQEETETKETPNTFYSLSNSSDNEEDEKEQEEELPTFHEKLNSQIQVLADLFSEAAGSAIEQSEVLSKKGQKRAGRRANRLMNKWVDAVKDASEAYEEGLSKIAVFLDE